MSARLHLLSSILAACWFGSLCAIGFMAVPVVFAHLAPVALAGNVAARLFAAQGWMSVMCALMLLMLFRSRLGGFAQTRYDEEGQLPGAVEIRNRPDTGYLAALVAGLLLALILQWGVAPRIELRQNLALWHSVGTVLYVGQWLCALALVIKLAQRKP